MRWDGLRLVFNLSLIERMLRRRLADNPHLRDLRLQGEGDAVEASATVMWKGLEMRVAVDLAELRLRHRRLGLRLRRPRVLGGVRLPVRVVEAMLESAGLDVLTVIRGQAILILDLRPWLLPELTLTVITAQATAGQLYLWFGPGALDTLPGGERKALPASTSVG
jgi:hypothetical protein